METDSPDRPDIEEPQEQCAGPADSPAVPYLAPPPRNVPLSVRLGTLLGTPLGCFSWFFIGFGMIFVWVFGIEADFSSPLFLLGKRTAAGTVIGTEKTGYEAGEGESSPVVAYRFFFTASDGARIESTSYTEKHTGVQAGSAVTVEYLALKPSISRIEGMGRAPLSIFAAFTLLFPILGLAMLIRDMRYAFRALRLLRVGRLAYGIGKAKTATGERINDKRVYEYVFEFQADDLQTYQMKARSSATDALEDELHERVLYDPTDPPTAVMFDTLPGPPVIDSSGSFRAPARAWLGIVLLAVVPVATVVGHGIYIYNRFFR